MRSDILLGELPLSSIFGSGIVGYGVASLGWARIFHVLSFFSRTLLLPQMPCSVQPMPRRFLSEPWTEYRKWVSCWKIPRRTIGKKKALFRKPSDRCLKQKRNQSMTPSLNPTSLHLCILGYSLNLKPESLLLRLAIVPIPYLTALACYALANALINIASNP